MTPAPDQPDQPSDFASSRARTRGRALPLRLFGAASSVWSAALTIAVLAAVISLATYYERDYGRAPAAAAIYDAWWFNAIFAVLAVNIFGAAAVRYPWRRPQYGFVVVHLGLLTLIAGFWCSRDRLDGMLVARPGEPARTIELPRDRLAVDGGGVAVFDPLRDAGYPSFARFCLQLARLAPPVEPAIHRLDRPRTLIDGGADGVDVRLLRVLDTGRDEPGWIAAAPGAGAPVVKVELTARPPIGIEVPLGSEWLDFTENSEKDISQPGAPPVRIALGRTDSAEAAADFLAPPPIAAADGEVAVYWRGRRARFALTPAALPQAIEVADDLGLVIDLHVLHPRFDDGGLREDEHAALDPLLRVRVGVGRGDQRTWTNLPVFARMPCYARALVAARAGELPTIFFEHPACYAPQPGQGLQVQGLLAPDGRLRLRWLRDSKGLVGTAVVDDRWSGALVGGEGDPSPMRLTMNATFLASAERGPEALRMRADKREMARRWIEVEVAKAGGTARAWLASHTAKTVTLPAGPVRLSYAPQQYDLRERHGFALTLDRFIEGKDPGGLGSASYASEVTLALKDGGAAKRLITMNEPLREGGVTLYQSSFEQQRDEDDQPIPGAYRASVFTAATDPGRLLKYLGSGLLVAGILLLYWLRGAKR